MGQYLPSTVPREESATAYTSYPRFGAHYYPRAIQLQSPSQPWPPSSSSFSSQATAGDLLLWLRLIIWPVLKILGLCMAFLFLVWVHRWFIFLSISLITEDAISAVDNPIFHITCAFDAFGHTPYGADSSLGSWPPRRGTTATTTRWSRLLGTLKDH